MFVCFPELFEPTNETHKIQILTKNQLFYQNYEKSTIFDDFGKKVDFLSKFAFYEDYL